LADEFQLCCARARETLERWVPPAKALAVIHHAQDLTEEDANQLEEIAASGKARLKIEPKRID
jgi:hypothetical protein